MEEPREEAGREKHGAPRGPKPLPLGMRPGCLPDPGPPPLVEVATVGHVAASVPFPGSPSLAGASADAVDGRTVSFFLTQSLTLQKEKEDEEAEKERK